MDLPHPCRTSVFAAAVSLAVACGGKAIVDGAPGSGGATGAGGKSSTSTMMSTSTMTSTGTSVLCPTSAPVGQLMGCSGSAGTGTCGKALCDSGGSNIWESKCSPSQQGCVCQFNGKIACTCSVSAGQLCSGTPSCCPAPFPK